MDPNGSEWKLPRWTKAPDAKDVGKEPANRTRCNGKDGRKRCGCSPDAHAIIV